MKHHIIIDDEQLKIIMEALETAGLPEEEAGMIYSMASDTINDPEDKISDWTS